MGTRMLLRQTSLQQKADSLTRALPHSFESRKFVYMYTYGYDVSGNDIVYSLGLRRF